MNFNKRVNGSWVDTPNYIHNTSTDTITTLPVDIYPNAETATVGLKGNMSQSGAPTPQNPIQPSETGERTGNLFDIEKWLTDRGVSYTIVDGKYEFNTDISLNNNVYYFATDNISVSISGLIEVVTATSPFITLVNKNGGNAKTTALSPTTIKSENILCAGLKFNWNTGGKVRLSNIMLNTGSTALPYENFGYKIPISSAGQTTTVYLGEVETTRRIRKLVFDGTEEWTQRSGTPENIFFLEGEGSNYINNNGICSHYANQDSGSFPDFQDKHFLVRVATSGTKSYLAIRDSNYETVWLFKAYLADQYAAGTPVTVWYVLAEPETAVVNEPIRKIDDYADEVSGISIPVTAGGDTLSVGTTVQPSEVTVNYKGWHPVADVHERDNGAWT